MIQRDPSRIKLSEDDLKEWKDIKKQIQLKNEQLAQKQSSPSMSEHTPLNSKNTVNMLRIKEIKQNRKDRILGSP